MFLRVLVAAAAALAFAGTAAAKDPVRIVDTQAQIYIDLALYIAEQEGYYAAENIEPTITLGRGGAESLQVVVTGSADMVWGPGVLSVISAYAKGAPVKIIANAAYGARETFWIVKADSPIKSIKDLDGKVLAYSAAGSLTHLLAQTIAKDLGVKPKLVATGNMSSSRTQMMSGQTDTAWSAFPAGLSMVKAGEARIIGTGNDAVSLRNLSTRVVVANSNWLAKNRDVAVRAMRAIWKGEVFAMTDPRAPARFAEKWKLDPEDTKAAWEYNKLEDVAYAPIGELDRIIALAQEYGFIKEPLTAEQKAGLVDIVYDPKK
ncbi:MAG: ABC transporter substrate-binding protein [Rhodospirillales bacterium]